LDLANISSFTGTLFLPLRVQGLERLSREKALFSAEISASEIPIASPPLCPGDRLEHLASLELVGADLDHLLPVGADPPQLGTRRMVPKRSRSIIRR
jgi:hypothetical protein